MINYKNDLRILAIIEVVIALLMAIPTVMSVVLKEQEALRGGAAFERTFDWLGMAVEDNAIRLTANGSSAQDVDGLADLIVQKITRQIRRKEAAYGLV